MFKWRFHILIFATNGGKYQNKEKPLKRQRKLGLYYMQLYNLITYITKMGIPGVPKHMKRFESLITFDSIKICCLLFLLVNTLYIEII